MDVHGWVTLMVLGLVLFAMAREVAGPDLVMMAGLLALASIPVPADPSSWNGAWQLGVLTPAETFGGFSSPVLPTVGGLLILSAALRETGAIEIVFRRLIGRSKTEVGGLVRLAPATALGSAFLNNVTIVAMMTPILRSWARRLNLSHSHMLLPINYATILGSVVTMIGTSTTLVAAQLMQSLGLEPMTLFEMTPVGLPLCLVGLVFLVFAAPRVLPDRREPVDEVGEHRREYTGSMVVEPGSPLVGQSIEEAGLRQLPGLFLVEIERAGRILSPVGPDRILEADDRLVFAGVVSTILDLHRIRGLAPATESDEAEPRTRGRDLIEAVMSNSSPLVGSSIRDANFRTVYDAAVIAVHRNRERVGGKIGEIVLRPGDTLLLQTAPGFIRVHRNSPDFYLVSSVDDAETVRHDRAWVAGAILVAMLAAVTTGLVPIAIAALLAGGLLVATRCITGAIARRSVEWSILIVIGAGLGIATAMDKTGAAAFLANLMVQTAGSMGPLVALAAIYVATMLLAEFLNHAAAAAILMPIAVATAHQLGVDPRSFAMAVAFAASCAFAVPVTYQTHLIVYGPGGYRFGDFVRLGVPLDLLCAAVAIVLIPYVWPL